MLSTSPNRSPRLRWPALVIASTWLAIVSTAFAADKVSADKVSADKSPLPAPKPGQWCGVHVMAWGLAGGPDGLAPLKEAVAKVLAPGGVNVIVLAVGYNYEYKSHPELRQTKFITKAQARDLVRHCREHGIRLIPLMNCLGHQSWGPRPGALLKAYPQFDETPSIPLDDKKIYCREWCPSHPDVNKVVFDLLDELIEAFDADAMHVGMDEVFLIGDKDCPRCKGKDVGELFAKVVNELHGHLVGKRGVEMLIWSDRLLDSSATGYGKWEASATGSHRAIDRVPKDIILCDWHYEPPETYRRMGQQEPFPSIRFFQEKGFRVLPATWRTPEACVAMIRASRQGATDKMLGILFTGWSNGPGGASLLAALRGEEDTGKSAETAKRIAATMRAGLEEISRQPSAAR